MRVKLELHEVVMFQQYICDFTGKKLTEIKSLQCKENTKYVII